LKGQLAEMMSNHARAGRLDWIGIRSERLAPVTAPSRVLIRGDGLEGDHGRAGKRAVTLIQQEHLAVIRALADLNDLQPEQLRRNLLVSGINFYALRKSRIRVGEAILRVEGPCPPCSRMEAELGHGGYNAMRGHGGWYASVIAEGHVALGDPVQPDF